MKSISARRRQIRDKRKTHIRKRLAGTAARPRVSIYRSHRNIYAQVIDDDEGKTLLACNGHVTGEGDAPEGVTGKCAVAYLVGKSLAEKAKEQGIEAMVFDRSGYLYHGRVAALARGLRDGGMKV